MSVGAGRLEAAIAAANEAGDLLRSDFHRLGGPRGKGDKADADLEAEAKIRSRLLRAFPTDGYLGEETGRAVGKPGNPVWVVDPNDGTRDYLKGSRGSSVSIALVSAGRPVLGVVFAFGYPDDRGDLFTWSERGGGLHRNGRRLEPRPGVSLGAQDVVLVSSSGDRDPVTNLRCSQPARFRTVPSIAHRLALVAAGEAAATSSIFGPVSWDFAGGHALLRGAERILLDQTGKEVVYDDTGWSRTGFAFAGSEPIARLLSNRRWARSRGASSATAAPLRLERGHAVADPQLLSRAQGCLLGLVTADNLGASVEGSTAEHIAPLLASRQLDDLTDGGRFGLLAGQPSDDSEMALVLARLLIAHRHYDTKTARRAYRDWVASRPVSIGARTRAAIAGRLRAESTDTNGSLMRAAPLGVFGHRLHPADLAQLAREESASTHPGRLCGDAVAAYVIAIAHQVRSGDGAGSAYEAALRWADAEAVASVRHTLRRAPHEPPPVNEVEGSVLTSLHNAFHALITQSDLPTSIRSVIGRGCHTDTNAAVTGGLLGAVHGREGVPDQWRIMALSCRPHRLRTARPRPVGCWPTDVLEIAERLLLAGEDAR